MSEPGATLDARVAELEEALANTIEALRAAVASIYDFAAIAGCERSMVASHICGAIADAQCALKHA